MRSTAAAFSASHFVVSALVDGTEADVGDSPCSAEGAHAAAARAVLNSSEIDSDSSSHMRAALSKSLTARAGSLETNERASWRHSSAASRLPAADMRRFVGPISPLSRFSH